jgi:hypothetical protein
VDVCTSNNKAVATVRYNTAHTGLREQLWTELKTMLKGCSKEEKCWVQIRDTSVHLMCYAPQEKMAAFEARTQHLVSWHTEYFAAREGVCYNL